jgi:LacI family transcriptional regulator
MLFIESSRAFGQGLLRGVAKYARLKGPWMFYRKSPHFLRESDTSARHEMQEIRKWQPHGAMYWPHSFTPKDEHIGSLHLEKLFSMNIPIALPSSLAPGKRKNVIDIRNDIRQICRMAAEHLLERGLRNFAFCGYSTRWSQAIGEHFAEFINDAGFEASFYREKQRTKEFSLVKEEELLADWLKSLPRPIGIMAINDDRSQDLIEAAKIARLQIPQEIAVLGVDNDEFVCDLC